MVKRIKLDAAPEVRVYLAEWRETKFPTQQLLADAMGTTTPTISRIETGDREWGKGYLEALAHLVKCRVVDLFRKPGEVEVEDRLERLMAIAVNLSEGELDNLIGLLDRGRVSPPPKEQPSGDLEGQRATTKSI